MNLNTFVRYVMNTVPPRARGAVSPITRRLPAGVRSARRRAADVRRRWFGPVELDVDMTDLRIDEADVWRDLQSGRR